MRGFRLVSLPLQGAFASGAVRNQEASYASGAAYLFVCLPDIAEYYRALPDIAADTTG